MTQVNKERMLAEFKEIVALPCHSLQERPVFELLKGKLEALGFTVEEDFLQRNADYYGAAAYKSAFDEKTLGGNCGNLWAFLPASAGVEGAVRVLLSAHMDGVEPCGGTTVIQKDGVLYSDGTTILGGDDKSGVEGILEGIRLLLEEGAPHGDIQILFTVCEEGVASTALSCVRTLAMHWTAKAHRARLLSALPARRNIKSTLSAEPRMADWSRKRASTLL